MAQRKLEIFTHSLINISFRNHPLFSTFLNEWEYEIDTANKKVSRLALFDEDQSIVEEIKFHDILQGEYYEYFEEIGLFNAPHIKI